MVINITDKLSKDKPILQIKSHKYEIQNSVELMLTFSELEQNTDINKITLILKKALGNKYEEVLNYCNNMSDLHILVKAILACIKSQSMEELEQELKKK